MQTSDESEQKDTRCQLADTWPQLSSRKRRLFLAACARLSCPTLEWAELQQAIGIAERYADGLETESALLAQVSLVYRLPLERPSFQNWIDASPRNRAWFFSVVTCVGKLDDPVVFTSRLSWQESVLVTNPYHLSVLHELCPPPERAHTIQPGTLSHPTLEIAGVMYSGSMFTMLPTLADFVEADGCQDAVLLDHLRHSPFHVRGCWALDAILGFDRNGH